MNKLETSLSQNDLNCLFSTKVEKASNNYFYIMTKTHKSRGRNRTQSLMAQQLNPLTQQKPLSLQHQLLAQNFSLTVLHQSKTIRI